jgi:cold shock protein
MSQGKVKWFSNAKGYGFIRAEAITEKDIFVHYSSIKSDGYRSLNEGDPVEFELIEGPKGPKAENVSKAENAGITENAPAAPAS